MKKIKPRHVLAWSCCNFAVRINTKIIQLLRKKSFINQNNQEVFVKLSKKLDRIDLEEMAYFQIFREEEHGLTIPKEDAISMSEIILELTK